MEVENVKLRVEFVFVIVLICFFSFEVEYGLLDDSKFDNLLKDIVEKIVEVLK